MLGHILQSYFGRRHMLPWADYRIRILVGQSARTYDCCSHVLLFSFTGLYTSVPLQLR